MEKLEKVHIIIKKIAEDPKVNISKVNDYTFDVIIDGELMNSFEKLGNIQKEIEETCSNEYTLKTIYGDGQDAKLILEKN